MIFWNLSFWIMGAIFFCFWVAILLVIIVGFIKGIIDIFNKEYF
ncbi:hypothetical protein SAG0027_00185 [Streptococcus agalactiae FSL S3-251]|uniref:Uncharacterized protein n=1 Tax=Streptococcus agalactiae TaxID=1311 RepID=A0AB74H7J7_STRAG|nr:hypothetical protein SAG0027_00185 [Streptococcus agalactiae FSL S3-251]EPV91337.1 hypothetical protein SAG0014_12315 [Streptococcus agalactiae FSL S3-586]SIW58251.1 hypothetical protein BQ8897_BM110_01795 [Streptococcus agalactiae]SUN29709.1 Uncharacterised protein [Streptococcus agalactiae]